MPVWPWTPPLLLVAGCCGWWEEATKKDSYKQQQRILFIFNLASFPIRAETDWIPQRPLSVFLSLRHM